MLNGTLNTNAKQPNRTGRADDGQDIYIQTDTAEVLEKRRTEGWLPSSKHGERVQRIKVNEGSTVRSVKTLSEYSLSGGFTKGLPVAMKRRFCFGPSFGSLLYVILVCVFCTARLWCIAPLLL